MSERVTFAEQGSEQESVTQSRKKLGYGALLREVQTTPSNLADSQPLQAYDPEGHSELQDTTETEMLAQQLAKIEQAITKLTMEAQGKFGTDISSNMYFAAQQQLERNKGNFADDGHSFSIPRTAEQQAHYVKLTDLMSERESKQKELDWVNTQDSTLA